MQAVCPLSRAVSRGCCVLRRLVLPAVGSELAYSYVRFLLFRPGGALGAGSVCPPSVAVSPECGCVPGDRGASGEIIAVGAIRRRRSVTAVGATIVCSICTVLSVRGALCAGGVSAEQGCVPWAGAGLCRQGCVPGHAARVC